MRMGHAARQGEEVTRADVEPIAAALEDVLALQDVEQFVLVLVDVQRRVEQRWQLLPHRDGGSRRLTRTVPPPNVSRLPLSAPTA
jgi:hypothetical protein